MHVDVGVCVSFSSCNHVLVYSVIAECPGHILFVFIPYKNMEYRETENNVFKQYFERYFFKQMIWYHKSLSQVSGHYRYLTQN